MSTSDNRILGLKLPTDPRWVNLTEISLQAILSDHAYCELKAATNCISLIQLYSGHDKLVQELSPIVTEEWGHFRMVLAELKKRNLSLEPQRKDEYVNMLLQKQIKGGSSKQRLLDKLLICALIEARSCERFRLLSHQLSDEYMRDFYYKFMVSEAAHYTLFLELANEYIENDIVKQRWQYWLTSEIDIMNALEMRGDRIH